MPKTIYALLVGINDYQKPVPKLGGCRGDVASVETYLKSLPDTTLHLKTLLDKEAIKSNIIAGFREHLAKAKADDVALFYFSGHGTQEKADPVFWPSEPSKRLQSLVCYDGIVQKNGEETFNLLADKELRYLLHELSATEAHVLSIFDCCHSGDNVRGKAARRYAPRLTYEAPLRPWEQFIFSDRLKQEAFANKPIVELLPEGRHIQIAACAPDEKAYEDGGKGLFTAALLDVLKRSDNYITYYDLQSRVRNFLKGQTPRVYASRSDPDEVFHFFLDRDVPTDNLTKGLLGNVIHRAGEGWWLDMGHLHGVSEMVKTVEVTSLDQSQKLIAQIGKIEASRTQLLFEPNAALSETAIYKAAISDFLSAVVKVFFKVETTDAAGLRYIEQAWKENSGRNLLRAEQESEADYTLHIADNRYSITKAEDPKQLPLVPVMKGFQYSEAKIMVQYLRHISRWEFVKNLHNPKSWLFKTHPIEVQFFKVSDTGDTPLPLENDEVILPYTLQPDGKFSGHVKIQLTNRSDRKLHVALLYLSMNFGSSGVLLKPTVVQLAPNESALAYEGGAIPFSYEKQVEEFNWPTSLTYLKLIANTAFFDIAPLTLEELPAPLAETKRDAGRKAPSESSPDAQDWITRLITLRMPNPKYKEEG